MSIPIILGNVSTMMLGIIDAAMIGAVDYKQLAASSLVINILGIPYVAAIGMTMALSPLVAIERGKENAAGISHYLFNGFWLCAITGLLISIFIHLNNNMVFKMKQDADVATYAAPYLMVMGWSTIPMVLFLALKQFADALEHTRFAMILSILALPVNAFLNWIFIYGKFGIPSMELYGAGIATLITRILIFLALLLILLFHKDFKIYLYYIHDQWKIKGSTLVRMAKIGIPSSLQYGMEAGAFSVSGILIGVLGATQQAAHQIALNCAALAFMFSLGLSQAGSIRVSHALGMNQWQKVLNIGKGTILTAGAIGLCFACIFVIFHQQLPYFFNDKIEVIELASILLIFAAIFQVSDATQAIGVGLLRGITDVKVPTVLVAVAYWGIGLPLGTLLGFYFNLGASGMWIGLTTGLSFSAILLNIRFIKKVKLRIK